MAEAKWYVVHTYSGYENKVKANIEKTIENNKVFAEQILEVRVPLEEVVELFDTGAVLVPEEDMNLTDGYSFDIGSYSNDGGCIETNGSSIAFINDGTVIVSISGADIIMYGSGSDIVTDIPYSAAVRYSGKSVEKDANSDVIAAMDSNAEVLSKSGAKIYIGKNVKFTINKKGTVDSEEIR